MTEQSKPTPRRGSTAGTAGATGNAAAAAVDASTRGDHDRVAMLSLRADGTPDQTAPEFIGDRETALAATTEQFRQQAVSAADQRERAALSGDVTLVGGKDGEVTAEPARSAPDPQTQALKDEHEKAARAAEAAAEATVAALHAGDDATTDATTDGKASR